MRWVPRGLVLAAAALALLAAAGCGNGVRHSAQAVHVTVRDFRILAPAHVRAGDVDFVVHNAGPDDHEFIVVRSSTRLPLRTDGVTADEDAFERATVGSLEPGRPGGTRHLRVHLRPGRYELLCNMAGHYLGGMRTEITVS
jgi:uncharacterized cupredoxin-like copper-binding protein